MTIKNTQTGQLKPSRVAGCPIFIPKKIDYAILEQLTIGGEADFMQKNYNWHGCQPIIVDYLFKFFAGDKNMERGFADVSVVDLHLWHRARFATDVFVKQVYNSTTRFNAALLKLDDHAQYSVTGLSALNKMLRPRANNHGVRRHAIKAGDPRTNRHAFYCLPATNVDEYLTDLIAYMNTEQNDINKALMVYWQLIAIHPYRDGNGRLARLLFLHMMSKRHDPVCSALLLLYLKSINRKSYIAVLHQYRLGKITVLKNFYLQAIDWCHQSVQVLSGLLKGYHEMLSTTDGMQMTDAIHSCQQLVIKQDKSTEKIPSKPPPKALFQLKAIKSDRRIYINQPLVSYFNHFDYYLRSELRTYKQ